jgi:putative endonuclease
MTLADKVKARRLTLVIPAQAGIQGRQLGACCTWTGFRRVTEKIPRRAARVIPAQAGIEYDLDMESQPCVYILASKRNGTLYTGVTHYPAQRIWQHKRGLTRGFTKKYGVHRLVYIELHETIPAAIQREKQIKVWKRAWKLQLIESVNPSWRDLYEDFCR